MGIAGDKLDSPRQVVGGRHDLRTKEAVRPVQDTPRRCVAAVGQDRDVRTASVAVRCHDPQRRPLRSDPNP